MKVLLLDSSSSCFHPKKVKYFFENQIRLGLDPCLSAVLLGIGDKLEFELINVEEKVKRNERDAVWFFLFSRVRPPLDTGQAIPPNLPSPSRPPDDKPKKIIVSRYTHPMNIDTTSVCSRSMAR